MMIKPERALVSVYNKEGLVDFCSALKHKNVEIVATSGTKKYLSEKNIDAVDTKKYTGFDELLEGRVKTLHTRIHAAILAKDAEIPDLLKDNIPPINMVICNFYPYTLGIDNIDIGGPAFTRAAAKNWQRVIVVSNPSQYDELIQHIEKGFNDDLRKQLAIQALQQTAYYDSMILKQQNQRFPHHLCIPFRIKQELRYGENPHQQAAFYEEPDSQGICIATAQQLQGKALSYNNILDAHHAIECIKEFQEPTAVIVKHATPSGIASDITIEDAYKHAFETDVYSPFGGVIAVNREVTKKLAASMTQIFLEVIISPSYSNEALTILKKKKNLRLLTVKPLSSKEPTQPLLEIRSVGGGALLQEKDITPITTDKWQVVTAKKPTAKVLDSMVFALKCVRHVKSNSVVFVKDKRTVAIGGGQTSRVDASWIAVHKGGDNVKNSIMASDAFFPFRDAVDVAAQAGVTAIVQPGGSIRDDEVIQAANEHNIVMVFTGQRYFLH